VAAACIEQVKVRRTITCFQRSWRYAGNGRFRIGADHGFANLGRYLRHELGTEGIKVCLV
jgi:hypothetical protein